MPILQNIPTLRLVWDNRADFATVTSSAATAPGLGVANLKTDIRSQICRVLSNTTTFEVVLDKKQTIGCVAFPTCNLSSDSTIAIAAYEGATLKYSLAATPLIPGTILGNWDFTQNLNVNNFQDNAATGVVWFDPQFVDRLTITISDPQRTFLDFARLVIGPYFQPRLGASYGSSLGTGDSSQNIKTASGDIRTDWGPKTRTMELRLDEVLTEDRERIIRLIRRGVGQWTLVSACAGDVDPVREQDYTIYGKPMANGSAAFINWSVHQTNFTLEGWA